MRIPPLPFRVRPRGDTWAPGWCIRLEVDEYSTWAGVALSMDATEPEHWEDVRYTQFQCGKDWYPL